MNEHWEYKEELVSPENFTHRVNQLGQEGWQVYNQERVNESEEASYRVFMKRLSKGPQLLKS